jgi:transcriptional regulator with XRE-family HTH domain
LLAWLRRSALQRQELAAQLGVSKAYVSQILAGVRRPGLDTLVKIEALTGIPCGAWAETAASGEDRPKARIKSRRVNSELTAIAGS